MNIPQFNAEASLGPIMGVYRGNSVAGGPERSEISMQQVGAPSSWFRLKCCGYSQWLHRFYCITKTVSAFDRCKCRRFPDGSPFIDCDPLVIETYPLDEADRVTSKS